MFGQKLANRKYHYKFSIVANWHLYPLSAAFFFAQRNGTQSGLWLSVKNALITIFHSPVSQVSPLNPGGHIQLKLLRWSLHVALFQHGELSQLFLSAKRRGNKMNLLSWNEELLQDYINYWQECESKKNPWLDFLYSVSRLNVIKPNQIIKNTNQKRGKYPTT